MTMTHEEFERWLALQLELGYTLNTPEAVEKIRAAYRAGALLTSPFFIVHPLSTHDGGTA